MNLPSPKTKSKSVQVGRGYGSKRGGHTTGRGTKGQKSRSGYTKARQGFEGGQNPLAKRLPKLKNKAGGSTRSRAFITSKIVKKPLQLSMLAENFNDGDVISIETLIEKNIIKPLSHKTVSVKVLFDYDIDKKLEIQDIQVSGAAKEAIEKAGGKVN